MIIIGSVLRAIILMDKIGPTESMAQKCRDEFLQKHGMMML